MVVNNRTVEKFRTALAEIFWRKELSDVVLAELASNLASDTITQRAPTQRELVTVKSVRGQPPTVVYYNPMAAIKIIAHAFEAAAHYSNYVLMGAAALSCGAAIKELCHTITSSEAVLFCSLYFSDGSRADRETAIRLFNGCCNAYSEVNSEDFEAALQSLLANHFIAEENGTFRVTERVRILNVAAISDSRHA